MPLTPRSPRPRIREPATHQLRPLQHDARCTLHEGIELTIGHDRNASLVDARPVAQDLANVALVLDGDELRRTRYQDRARGETGS